MIPFSTASVRLWYSTDNATWKDLTYVNQTSYKAYVINLQSGTTYYFRAQNGTSDYVYLTQTTKDEVNNMSLAAVIGLGIVLFAFLFWAFKLDQEHFLFKLLLLFFSCFIIVLIPSALLNGTNVLTTFNKVTLWFFRLLFIYFFVYLLYNYAKRKDKLPWDTKKE